MTLKFYCKCGSEFYISFSDESVENSLTMKAEARRFRQLHKGCGGFDEDETKNLPKDWQV